jgi:hypothetical protein
MMRFPAEQVAELARLCPGVQQAEVGGVTVFRIPALPLPDGCTPEVIEALLYPVARDGYASRLFFAEQVRVGPSRNWNGSLSFGGRSWSAISWTTPPNLRLAEMVMVHLRAFKKGGGT